MNNALQFEFGNNVMPPVNALFNERCFFVSNIAWRLCKASCGWRFNCIYVQSFVCAVFAAIWQLAPVHPLRRQHDWHAAGTRERNAALSGFSRASRCTILSFQRLAPSLPLAISAEVLHSRSS